MSKILQKPVRNETKTSEPKNNSTKTTSFSAFSKGYMSGILNEKCPNPYKTNKTNISAWLRGKEQGLSTRKLLTKDLRIPLRSSKNDGFFS